MGKLGKIEEVYLSPSAINNFDSCESKFYFSRMLKPTDDVKVPIYFKRGLEAHKVMEGKKGKDDVSPEAWKMASKMQKIVKDLRISVIHHEATQKFFLYDEFMFERRIDALGYDNDGTPIIIDWKTASRKWKTYPAANGEYIAPKAYTWQTPGYFVQPPLELLDEIGWDSPWPSRMAYIVGPLSGQGQIFRVEQTDEMMVQFQNMIQKIKHATDRDYYSLSRGFGCDYCDFRSPCFDAPGWEENFKLRFDKTKED